MTKDLIIQKLQSDAPFALHFIADNNLNGAVAILAKNGYFMPVSTKDKKSFVFDTLFEILNKDKQKAIEIVSQIPYNKGADAAQYTQGFNDYFMRTQPATMTSPQGKFSLDALFAGLGTGLSTYAGVSLANTPELGGVNATNAKTEAEKAAAEAEAKRKKTNLIIGLSVGGLIILGVIIYFVTRPKKEK